jgi:hypothetical protein
MRKYIFVSLIAALLAGGCISGTGSYRSSYDFSSIDKIAIVAVEGEVTSEQTQNQIANFFAMELLDKGYSPIMLSQVRAKTRAIMEELEIDLTKPEAYTDLGKALNVPAILVVDIPYYNEDIFINAQLIDVRDGSILWMDRKSGKTGRSTADDYIYGFYPSGENGFMMDPSLMFTEPPQMEKEQPERGLTPNEADKIEKVVSRVCRSLPSPMKRVTEDW